MKNMLTLVGLTCALAISASTSARAEESKVVLKNATQVCIRFDVVVFKPAERKVPPVQVGPYRKLSTQPDQSVSVGLPLYAKDVKVYAQHGKSSDCKAGFVGSWTAWENRVQKELHLTLHKGGTNHNFYFTQP